MFFDDDVLGGWLVGKIILRGYWRDMFGRKIIPWCFVGEWLYAMYILGGNLHDTNTLFPTIRSLTAWRDLKTWFEAHGMPWVGRSLLGGLLFPLSVTLESCYPPLSTR